MSITEQRPPLLTIADAAVRLNLSEHTIRRRVASGELPAVRLGGLIRIDQDDLERWLLEQRITTRGPA